jgi:hypothetical protein
MVTKSNKVPLNIYVLREKTPLGFFDLNAGH